MTNPMNDLRQASADVSGVEVLSPAARAVLDAANTCNSYGPNDCLNESRWIVAAALRAAADQVVPEFWHEEGDIYAETKHDVRADLLAIADELEAQ